MLRSSSKCCRWPRISCSMILDILTCSPFWEEKLKLMVFRTLFTLRSIFNFSYYLHLNNKIWTQEHVQSIKLISMIELRQSRPIPHQLVKISTQLQLCTSNTDIKLQTRITFAVIPRPIPTPNFQPPDTSCKPNLFSKNSTKSIFCHTNKKFFIKMRQHLFQSTIAPPPQISPTHI